MQNGPARLRQWIERSKLNQREAAQLLGFDQTFLSQLLNGKRSAGLDTALKIERVTGIVVESWAANDIGGVPSIAQEIPVKPCVGNE